MNPKEQGPERKELDLGKIEYLISDWDGTLVDSMPAYTESFSKTLEEALGVRRESAKRYYLSTVGSPLSKQLKEGAKRFANIDVDDTTNLEKEFWRNLTGLIPEIIPRAKEFLTQVKRKGIKIVVWSGTRGDVLEEKIRLLSFSSFIDYSIGNEPGSSTLVKGPGLFREIAEYFGINEDELREKSLVIGDGSGDITAGKAVGVTTIGIVRTQTAQAFQEAGADIVVNGLEELISLFK